MLAHPFLGCISLPMSSAVIRGPTRSPAKANILADLLVGWSVNMGRFCCWPIFWRLCQCRTLRTRGEMNSGGNAGSWGRQQNPTKTTQKRTQRLYQPASSVGCCSQRIQAVDIKDSTFDGNSDRDAMAVAVLLFFFDRMYPHTSLLVC